MHERYIARQPIFDVRMKLFGYELLFRDGPKNSFSPAKHASSSVIVDSTMLYSLDALVGGAKAFINLDLGALMNGSALLLPPDRTIIEILESVEPTPEVIAACQDLCDKGYTLALDDFVEHAKWSPLTAMAKYLKIDFRISQGEVRAMVAERYLRKGLHLLAEKVETQEDQQDAQRLGYTFFQGYFFCKPNMVEGRDVSPNKLIYMRLLEAASSEDASQQKLEELIKQEPSLVFKLLRYLNSPRMGLRTEIRSIHHAITLLGDREFRRWVTILAVVAMGSGKPSELIRMALTRAYFCEEISGRRGMAADSADLFLMGLLSVADALLDVPIERVLASLPVSDDLRFALSRKQSRFSDVYNTVLSYERGDWKQLSATLAGRIDNADTQLPGCYMLAAQRANQIAA
ncbi:MAG TPA: HDOD domain-containing protein [Candidatus Dormibacteraeota bacterium]|nr:HDOD domain-containing protein [Candidatus Dormibacteraeota bacterium]